jgi:hypothetical protein
MCLLLCRAISLRPMVASTNERVTQEGRPANGSERGVNDGTRRPLATTKVHPGASLGHCVLQMCGSWWEEGESMIHCRSVQSSTGSTIVLLYCSILLF